MLHAKAKGQQLLGSREYHLQKWEADVTINGCVATLIIRQGSFKQTFVPRQTKESLCVFFISFCPIAREDV